MDLIDYIYDECHRQHVTNYGDFARAHEHMGVERQPSSDPLLQFKAMVMMIAFNVEPKVNNFRNYGDPFNDNLRTSHVGFMHGGSAAPAGEVRERFDRWCETAFYYVHESDLEPTLAEIDFLIKNLLDIHPWPDGNGRTASILRNWMLGTLDDPTPLPYYYGNA